LEEKEEKNKQNKKIFLFCLVVQKKSLPLHRNSEEKQTKIGM